MHLVARLDGFHWSLEVDRVTKDFGFLTLLRKLSRSKIKDRRVAGTHFSKDWQGSVQK